MKQLQKFKKTFFALTIGISIFSSFAFVDNYFEISKNLDVFATMFKELNTYYVDDIDPNKLMKTGIEAMLESLDPYTNFYSEADMEDYKFKTTGKYGGIGALIQKQGGYVVISEPYEGYPAHKSDLRAGDAILEIEGISMKNKNTEDVSKVLKGAPGTEVKVLIKRPGEKKELLKILSREEIKISNIRYADMLDNNIGYIRLGGFTEKAGKELRTSLEEMKKNNLKGIILDLRGNPGGLLNEAINITNVFIEKGKEVVSTKGKVKEWDKNYKTLNSAVDAEIPLVILTDRASASASEIVAGAIQDLDRGVVIGQKTFGKGLVQSARPLSYNTQLQLTIAKYYIPSGRCIQAIDYSHKNEDGSIGKIPDSLKTAFKTSKGRTVYDGGGIDPDIVITPDKYNNITIALLTKHLVFDYATEYRNLHDSIVPSRKFRLSDKDFDNFVAFLKDKEYDYKTKSEDILQQLNESTKDEKYLEAIKEDLEILKTKIMHDKEKDLYKHKQEIMQILEQEIASRYFLQKGRIESMLDEDNDIMKAMELLTNLSNYQAILNPVSKN